MPFITPDNLPTGLFCRQILIPNDPVWIGLVSGALLPYIYPTEWTQVDGITPEEAAARWEQMLNQYWMSQCEGGDDMGCEGGCPEVLRRINPDTRQIEISTDGGSTWMLDPNSPIAQIVAQPPPVPAGISATKCDAATNGKTHIEDTIASWSTQLGTATSVFDLCVAVCEAILDIALVLLASPELIPLATALATAIWGAGHAAFEFGQTAFDSYWTSDERDKILCALYCNIGDDGSFTQSQYDAFIAKWKTDATPSPAFNCVLQSVEAVGLKGLNNFCSYGEAADSDCSGCSCGECDLSQWAVYANGDEVSRDEVSIVINAVLNTGHYYVDIQSHVSGFDPDTHYSTNCCSWDWAVTNSTTLTDGEIHDVPCGGSYNANFEGGFSGDQSGHDDNVWYMEWKGSAPFQITLTVA